MQLIGLLRSPFVRRVAISLKYYGIPFERYPLSSFGEGYAILSAINPVAKLPTLVLDNGEVLMESSLILEYFESQVPIFQKLLPTTTNELATHLKIIGLALMGADKTVQLAYETQRRPEEKQYAEWIERLRQQIKGAFNVLESEIASNSEQFTESRITQAAISTAVAWSFNQFALPGLLKAEDYPALVGFTESLESLPNFIESPINQ